MQFHKLSAEAQTCPLVTMSAGNYGKAFARVAQQKQLEAVVFMPETAPIDRSVTLEVTLFFNEQLHNFV